MISTNRVPICRSGFTHSKSAVDNDCQGPRALRSASDTRIKSGMRGNEIIPADHSQKQAQARTKTASVALLLSVLLVSVQPAPAAGLRCEGKLTEIESIICRNEDLILADEIMNEIYRDLRQAGKLAPEEMARQRSWLQARERCKPVDKWGGETSCLHLLYSIRAEELARIVEKSLARPSLSPSRYRIRIAYEEADDFQFSKSWSPADGHTVIYVDPKGRFFAQTDFSVPGYGKVKQHPKPSLFDLQTMEPVAQGRRPENLKFVKPLISCDDEGFNKEQVPGQTWMCLEATNDWKVEMVGNPNPSKEFLDTCPTWDNADVLLSWSGTKLKRFRIVLANDYSTIDVNEGCGWTPGYTSQVVYSKRWFYEPSIIDLYSLGNGEMALAVNGMFLRFNKNKMSFDYPGIVLVEEEKIEAIRRKAWGRVDKTRDKIEQTKEYERFLDEAFAKLFVGTTR